MEMTKRHVCSAITRLSLLAAAALTAILSSGPGFAAAVEKPNITFGVLPVTNVAVVYLSLKQGFFQEEGLNVTPRMMGTASAVASIVGGDFDIADVTWALYLLSINRGIDLVAVSEGDRGQPGAAEFMVKADSPIKTTADLIGKKVGVVAIGGVCDYLLDDNLYRQGLDFRKVAYTPISPPDMPPTVLRGGLDAACFPEPILSKLKEQGTMRSVMDLFGGPYDKTPIAGFVVTAQFAASYPNTVAALRRALEKGLRFGNQNPDKVREILPTYTTMKPEDAQKITMTYMPPGSDLTQVRRIADIMKKIGALPPDAKIPAAIQGR
jgi:NitT/TauT family transport system substrate-binding protein